MSIRERFPFWKLSAEEDQRREHINDTLDTVYVLMPRPDDPYERWLHYTSDSLAESIRASALTGGQAARFLLDSIPAFRTADSVEFAFLPISKRETAFKFAVGGSSVTFCYDRKKFKVTNPGQKGMPKNPEAVFEDLIDFVSDDLVKPPESQ